MASLSIEDARQQRVSDRRELARDLAIHVGRTARVTATGNIELEPDAVMRLAQTCSAARTLTFGDYGSLSSKRFAAVMRACRDTTVLGVTITASGLALRYTTPGSRGGIVLTLHRIFDAAAVIVPLHVVAVEPPQLEPLPAPRLQPAPLYTAAAQPRRRWLRYFVDAIVARQYG